MPTIGEGIASAGRSIAFGISERGRRNRRREEDERRAEQERKAREAENRAIANEYGVNPKIVELHRAQGRSTADIHRVFSNKRKEEQNRKTALRDKSRDLGVPLRRLDLNKPSKPKERPFPSQRFDLPLKQPPQPTSLPKPTDNELTQRKKQREGEAENAAIAKRYNVPVSEIERHRAEGRSTAAIHAFYKPDKPTEAEKGATPRQQRSDELDAIGIRERQTGSNPQLQAIYRQYAEQQLPFEAYKQRIPKPASIEYADEFDLFKQETKLRNDYAKEIDARTKALIRQKFDIERQGLKDTFPDTRSGIDQQNSQQAAALNAQADANEQLAAQIMAQVEALKARLERIGQ